MRQQVSSLQATVGRQSSDIAAAEDTQEGDSP